MLNNQNTKDQNKTICEFCNKAFKRIKSHRCEMAPPNFYPQRGSSRNKMDSQASQPIMDVASVFEFIREENERARQHISKENERARESISRENDKKLELISKENDKKLELLSKESDKKLELKDEELKLQEKIHNEKMAFKYACLKQRSELADKFIQNSQTLKQMDIKAQDDYFTKRYQHEKELNNQITRISIRKDEYHTQWEMVSYGTASRKYFKTTDAHNHVDTHLFPPLNDEKRSSNCLRVVQEYNELRDSAHKTIDSMSSKHSFTEEDESPKEGNFVEMDAFDSYMHKMETTTSKRKEDDHDRPILTRDMKQACLRGYQYNYPGYPFNARAQFTKEQFDDECNKIDESFKKKDKLDIIKENILDPTHLLPSPEGDINTNPKEDKEPELVQYGNTLIDQEVIGSFKETPSAFKKYQQLEEESIQKLKKFFMIWVNETDCRSRPRLYKGTIIQSLKSLQEKISQGLGIIRAFLTTLKFQLLKHKSSYVPMFEEQMVQDQEFKKQNEMLSPEDRSHPVPSRLVYLESIPPERLFCATCEVPLNRKNFSKGHINPSNKGKLGTDYQHNLKPQCFSCNRDLGNMHMMLHKGFKFRPEPLLS